MRQGYRASDAGFSGSHQPPIIFDTVYKQSALRRVNAYLSLHNFPFSISLKPLPSARDITQTLHFLLLRLEFHSSAKIDDDLPTLLKLLGCPYTLTRSALRAPGTPHAFPHILAVIHWLVQIAEFKDRISAGETRRLYSGVDPITAYALRSYSCFMQGDDGAAEALKAEFCMKIKRENDALKDRVESLDKDISVLETQLGELRLEPSALEVLEHAEEDLEKDVMKLSDFIAKMEDGKEMMQKALVEKEKELAEVLGVKERTLRENDELKREVKEQGINHREADMMRREMRSVEREIRMAESAREEMENKYWSLDEKISQQIKALEVLTIKSNQTLRRLKIGGDLQYTLNTKGSTAVEVLGNDYKLRIKPAIKSLSQEIKKSSMTNSEELLALQQEAVDMSSKIEEKKKRIAELQQNIHEKETLVDALRIEIQDMESALKGAGDEVLKAKETEAHNLDIKEKEAKEALVAAKLKLAEMERRTQDEIQACASELFALIDGASKHKEYMEMKLQEMCKGLSEAAESMSRVSSRASLAVCLATPRMNRCS